MQLLIWSALLLALGLALVALEIFIPSGGILGLLAAFTLLVAIVVGFLAGPLVGLGLIGAAVIAVPGVIALGLRIWPSTPMGRRILLDVPSADDMRPDNEQLRELKQLVGRVGTTKTVMLPSGKIEIEGRSYDAIAPGMAIEPGQAIRVVEVRGTRVFVQPASAGDLKAAEQAKTPGGVLDQPIESLGIEDFEDPRLGNQT